MDWNNDGKKDLITGERDGYLRLFINSGTNASPVFNSFSFIQVGGNTFDSGYNSMPAVVDWNNDGKKDLLCGEHDGKIFLLTNVGADAAPVFQSTSYIQDQGQDLIIYSGRTSPDVVDWDRDGKKDILAGDKDGYVYFFRNVGTDAAPVFNGSVQLKAGGQTIDIGYNSRPYAVDWDNDQVMDLVCGCYDINASSGLVWGFHAKGPLAIDFNQLSVASGGAIGFELNAGPGYANRNYLIFTSITGTEPGTPLPGGMVLPINWDVLTNLGLKIVNSPIFSNFLGVLDLKGKAVATFNTFGPLPAGSFGVLSFAYGLGDPWDYVSNAASVEIVP